ncbi:RsiV family protein [Bacillus sp. 1P06AnD]|uniref:RsiV family protein n=1 Tax=Bacillus sp. 1P06AnD TaxID=3132208 RepID=UPI00399F05CF
MMDHKIDHLKNEYMNIPIPDELDAVVNKALSTYTKKKKRKPAAYFWSAAAAAAIVFMSVINISPAAAKSLSDVPVIGKLVEVLTFREYTYNDGNYEANIKVPAIDHLANKTLEKALNEKYVNENKQLYKDFQKEMDELKKQGGGHLGVDSGYHVLTDNDSILSIGRYTVNTVASSSTVMKYDTIDKKNQILITLPSLFKNDQYVKAISDNIIAQMKEQMKADSNKYYWVSEEKDGDFTDIFKTIKKDQNFYINNENKLVISFDKYEVAPGYMGICDFVIPTNVINKLLVSHEYIKK